MRIMYAGAAILLTKLDVIGRRHHRRTRVRYSLARTILTPRVDIDLNLLASCVFARRIDLLRTRYAHTRPLPTTRGPATRTALP